MSGEDEGRVEVDGRAEDESGLTEGKVEEEEGAGGGCSVLRFFEGEGAGTVGKGLRNGSIRANEGCRGCKGMSVDSRGCVVLRLSFPGRGWDDLTD